MMTCAMKKMKTSMRVNVKRAAIFFFFFFFFLLFKAMPAIYGSFQARG